MTTISVVWPGDGGRSGVMHLPWVPGKKLKHYLLEPVLRQQGVGALIKKCRIYNAKQQRIRPIYTPIAGDTIVFVVSPKR